MSSPALVRIIHGENLLCWFITDLVLAKFYPSDSVQLHEHTSRDMFRTFLSVLAKLMFLDNFSLLSFCSYLRVAKWKTVM